MPDISGPNRRGRCSLRRPIIPTHMVSVFRRQRSTARERNASIAAMDVLAALSAALARLFDHRAEAVAACIRAYDADPTLVYALNALLHLISDEPQGEAASAAVPTSARRPLSLVTCSNDDTQFAAMAASYDRALPDWPHDIVRIADATSLAEGYTRGVAAATGEIVIFSHDDVEILAADFGHRLSRRLAECDVLGVAGATRATGPAWPFAGSPFLHGSVIYPDETGYRGTVYSRNVPLARGIPGMDGGFLAMRREV